MILKSIYGASDFDSNYKRWTATYHTAYFRTISLRRKNLPISSLPLIDVKCGLTVLLNVSNATALFRNLSAISLLSLGSHCTGTQVLETTFVCFQELWMIFLIARIILGKRHTLVYSWNYYPSGDAFSTLGKIMKVKAIELLNLLINLKVTIVNCIVFEG